MPQDAPQQGHEQEQDQINLNIAAVQDFYAREHGKINASQRLLERISTQVGRPAFLGWTLAFVVFWILANTSCRTCSWRVWDPAPYFWLQGIVGLCALLIGTVVLTKQNRLDRMAEQRAHLDLKVTLLIEQKTAKLIDLMEELRRDLPNVRNRHDPDAEQLQQAMNPSLVLATLDASPLPSDPGNEQ